ncbi:MAG TPA: universal stress protein [Vicinamibacterales bacterium]|jgi:nucleotide-binding universal stress UspA family protein
MATTRRVLFASDFSKASRRAFTTAVATAKASRARLTIMHVILPFVPIVPEQFLDTRTYELIDKEARRMSQQHLRQLMTKATKAGVRVTGFIVEGQPAEEIARAVRTTRADLLVVGTHGRTGLRRFFVGSVASRLVATATCPVMTVRG